jgi:deoxyribose-phosphate aldolase
VLLRPDVTPGEVDDACASAVELGLAAVTVWPADVSRAAAASDGSRVTVVAAVGGPSGAAPNGAAPDGAAFDQSRGVFHESRGVFHRVGEALHQARGAIRAGAGHVAVALDPDRMTGGGAANLVRELEALCRMAHAEGVHVRAVLQAVPVPRPEPVDGLTGAAISGLGGVGQPRVAGLAEAGRVAVEAGADLLQTGFGLRAPATAEPVRAIRRALPQRQAAIGVIAAGAEDADAARHLLERAGADRVAVLDPAAVLRGVAVP